MAWAVTVIAPGDFGQIPTPAHVRPARWAEIAAQPVGIEARRRDDQAGDAEILVAPQAVAVLGAHAGRELDLLRPSPDLAALVAHRGEELREQIELAAGREEAVADARGAARRVLDVTADDDGDAAGGGGPI